MIILMKTEKALQNPASITDKNSQQTRNSKEFPQPDKRHLWKTYIRYYTKWWKDEYSPPKINKKAKRFTFITSIQHCTGEFSQGNKAIKRNKKHPDQKEEVNLFCFIDNTTIYEENPMESTKTLRK